MFQNLFKFNRKNFLVFFVVLSTLLLVFYQLYLTQLKVVKDHELNQYDAYMSNTIDHLIKEKNKTTQALANALSLPIDFRRALLTKDDNIRLELRRFSQQLRNYSTYKFVWIQLIDKEGISIGRSWTDKRGDNLKNIRKDIAEMIRHPRRIDSFSVGKFALTFKSIVPIFDEKGQLAGMLDVISQVNSIDTTLKENEGVHSVVLVDKSYRKQLTKTFTNKFIGDFYVANIDARGEDMSLIESYGAQKFFDQQGIRIIDQKIVSAKLVNDIYGKPMAVWLSIKPLEQLEFQGVENFKRLGFVLMLFIVFLVTFSLALYYLKRQVDFEKKFFFQVFENSTEIIYVGDRKSIIEANKQFFDFFENYHSLDQFHQDYRCVCELFVQEKGYLSDYVDGLYWHDYVLENGNTKHYAKVRYNDEISIFEVKVTRIDNPFERGEYASVLMTNITEEINYKQKLEHLIVHDELTGIYNRHFFNDALLTEINRSRRYKNPLSLLSFDIDHFKQINDEYGHDIGDEVLIETAQIIQQGLRETDHFCRIGGEEFAVLMPETDLIKAKQIAERLRESLEKAHFASISKHITISIGVVQLNQWDSEKTLYKRVDIAMYQAKENGRNCVVSAED